MTEEKAINLQIQKIYLKDQSFESASTPAIFGTKWQPEANVQVNTNAGKIADEQYESVLTITVTVQHEEKTVYISEVKYAALITTNATDQDLERILLSYCPNLLFPYIQETTGGAILKGGFPTFSLQPINFDALLENSKKQAQAENADAISDSVN